MAGGTDIYIISGVRKKQVRRPNIGAFNITADSLPDFDAWGPDEYWGCADWMTWHQLKKQAYGLEAANQAFIAQWGSQDSFMGPYNECKYVADFANYFSDQGIDTGWLLSHLVVSAQNAGDNVLHSATNLSSGLESVTKVVKVVAPVAAVLAGIWAVDKWVYPIFGTKKNA